MICEAVNYIDKNACRLYKDTGFADGRQAVTVYINSADDPPLKPSTFGLEQIGSVWCGDDAEILLLEANSNNKSVLRRSSNVLSETVGLRLDTFTIRAVSDNCDRDSCCFGSCTTHLVNSLDKPSLANLFSACISKCADSCDCGYEGGWGSKKQADESEVHDS